MSGMLKVRLKLVQQQGECENWPMQQLGESGVLKEVKLAQQLGENGVLKEVKLHGPVSGREWSAEMSGKL